MDDDDELTSQSGEQLTAILYSRASHLFGEISFAPWGAWSSTTVTLWRTSLDSLLCVFSASCDSRSGIAVPELIHDNQALYYLWGGDKNFYRPRSLWLMETPTNEPDTRCPTAFRLLLREISAVCRDVSSFLGTAGLFCVSHRRFWMFSDARIRTSSVQDPWLPFSSPRRHAYCASSHSSRFCKRAARPARAPYLLRCHFLAPKRVTNATRNTMVAPYLRALWVEPVLSRLPSRPRGPSLYGRRGSKGWDARSVGRVGAAERLRRRLSARRGVPARIFRSRAPR
jgi:hypothetical protein